MKVFIYLKIASIASRISPRVRYLVYKPKPTMKKHFIIGIALVSMISFSNCASIIHGPTQSVDLTSQPSGARITINGKYMGETPKTFSLRRKGYPKGEPKGNKEYVTKIELDGYYPYDVKIKRQMDGWFLGNILIGGVIGIAIDAGNGSMYKLTPDQVIAQMGKSAATTYGKDNDDIHIAVVLRADPSWQKIGSLVKR